MTGHGGVLRGMWGTVYLGELLTAVCDILQTSTCRGIQGEDPPNGSPAERVARRHRVSASHLGGGGSIFLNPSTLAELNVKVESLKVGFVSTSNSQTMALGFPS